MHTYDIGRVTRDELEAITDALNGQPLRCHKKVREALALKFYYWLHPTKAPDTDGWAPMHQRVPIRSSWPSGIIKKDKKNKWEFEKPSTTTPKAPKVPLTADEILAKL